MRRPFRVVPAPSSDRPDKIGLMVPAALFAPLLLLLLVAGMTWRSERQVAAVTDRVVHEYAAIVVWQYARRANMALHAEAMRALPAHSPGDRHMPFEARRDPGTGLPGSGGTIHTAPKPLTAVATFSYDPATREITSAGPLISAPLLAMIRRRMTALDRTARLTEEPHHVLFDSAGGRSYSLLVLVPRSTDTTSTIVRGIAVDGAEFAPVFARVLNDQQLLPTVAGTSRNFRDELAVRVLTRDGAVVFATDQPLGGTAATDTTGLQAGQLIVKADLPPKLASDLLIGAAPASQLPALGLMILVAAGVAVIGLAQHSRNRALAEAKSRFVANVSHELRTPLAHISMFAETLHLGRERSADERRKFAGVVFAEARRMTTLVENVLGFSRSGKSATALRLETQDVGLVLERAVNVFAPIAAAENVEVNLTLGDDVWANVDAAALQQIVLNLLDNAVKYGNGSRVELAATQSGSEVFVTVDDAGKGVPPEWRARVFDPYEQVAGRNGTGAGLGLAIVRDLTTAHGGRVWIEDSPMGGARLVVALPYAPAGDASGVDTVESGTVSA